MGQSTPAAVLRYLESEKAFLQGTDTNRSNEVQITFKLPKLCLSEAIDWQHLLQFGDMLRLLRWWPRPKIWNPHRPLKSWRNALDLAVFQLVALLKPSRVSGDCTLEAAPCNAFTTLGLKARHMDPEVQKWFAMFKFRRLESSYAAFPRRFFMTLRLDFGVGCDWPQPLLAIFTNRLQACLQPLYLEQAILDWQQNEMRQMFAIISIDFQFPQT